MRVFTRQQLFDLAAILKRVRPNLCQSWQETSRPEKFHAKLSCFVLLCGAILKISEDRVEKDLLDPPPHFHGY